VAGQIFDLFPVPCSRETSWPGGCPRHNVKRAPSPVGRKQNSAPALRQSLSPKDREVLKLQERAWLKQRDKVRNNANEFLRMTEERMQELNHMLTLGDN
jgi:hypothetical protein